MKEIAEEPSLRTTGTVVEVDHPTRGKYLTSHPVKMSDSITEVQRAPLIGEHTEEILTECSAIRAEEYAAIKSSGAITPSEKKETEALNDPADPVGWAKPTGPAFGRPMTGSGAHHRTIGGHALAHPTP